MNPLLEKLGEYKEVTRYRFIYDLNDGNNIHFNFRMSDFPHLTGMHKLTDIPIIQQFNDSNKPNISAKYILSRIKKERMLTDSIIRASNKFETIKDRYDFFNKDNLFMLSYTDVVIDFDASLVNSSLKAKYILFEEKNQGYEHLCIGNSAKGYYAESFFFQQNDRYIKGQKICKINKFTIVDENGDIYFEDAFV